MKCCDVQVQQAWLPCALQFITGMSLSSIAEPISLTWPESGNSADPIAEPRAANYWCVPYQGIVLLQPPDVCDKPVLFLQHAAMVEPMEVSLFPESIPASGCIVCNFLGFSKLGFQLLDPLFQHAVGCIDIWHRFQGIRRPCCRMLVPAPACALHVRFWMLADGISAWAKSFRLQAERLQERGMGCNGSEQTIFVAAAGAMRMPNLLMLHVHSTKTGELG